MRKEMEIIEHGNKISADTWTYWHTAIAGSTALRSASTVFTAASTFSGLSYRVAFFSLVSIRTGAESQCLDYHLDSIYGIPTPVRKILMRLFISLKEDRTREILG